MFIYRIFCQMLEMHTVYFLLFLVKIFCANAHPLMNDHANLAARSPPQIPAHERRGVSYNDVSLVSLFDKPGSQVTWRYNWDSSSLPSTSWFGFVPMLHSVRDDHTSRWRGNAEALARKNYNEGGKATWFLGFNEPDMCTPGAGGSCIDVPTAVAGWKKHMQPLSSLNKNIYLGSPAVTNAAPSDTTGLGWLAKFLQLCTGCSVDFINIHGYGAPSAQAFKSHMNAVRKIAKGRPIWITEFKPEGTNEQIKRFLEEVMPWVDNSADIHRYAYFMATPGEGFLVDGNRGLSEIGKTYTFFQAHGEAERTMENDVDLE
ncbi:glycoside hydrolase family 128 protein [Curvularia clavata]|uniref:Glycoside hydrolase family 128 protein n=1 Tax=Curvularia clavata TaxID=95742 RepID=A0A9Q9DXS6_CURCL|nr:glycoside hydrolase family 128 protein [Curvularia clavata]